MVRLNKRNFPREIRFIDLFCGIGGFRVAADNVFGKYGIKSRCVFSSDIDEFARESYHANFGDYPCGDITRIDARSIPDHDLLFAGFPCQPFSIIGSGKGFDDTRGALFFDILRILETKRPRAFVLENVKQLVGHNKGQTLKRILAALGALSYSVHYKVLNALNFGVPQKRERIFIVGLDDEAAFFEIPQGGGKRKSLTEILEDKISPKYFVSETIRKKRWGKHKPAHTPSIWHENKSGNICSYPYSCALRSGASHNYLLVNGERRLTPREMLRLQGFPDTFKIVCSDGQMKKQAGNAVPVTIVEEVLEKLLPHLCNETRKEGFSETNVQTAIKK